MPQACSSCSKCSVLLGTVKLQAKLADLHSGCAGHGPAEDVDRRHKLQCSGLKGCEVFCLWQLLSQEAHPY